jgi:predicted permease
VLGGLLLGVVVLYLPFLQTRFARNNRLRAFIQLGTIRRNFRYAPLAFAFALSIHLLFAIPLYVPKIELIPRDLMYLEGLFFLALIFPARVLDGWAYARSTQREEPRFWLFRWVGRLSVLPVIVAYVLAVFFSQHLGWYGASSLFEQHAFLLPAPFTK